MSSFSSSSEQRTFTFASERDFAVSSSNRCDKEAKLEKIRQMEDRMKQLQLERSSIHANVSERGERSQSALSETNSKLNERIAFLESELRQTACDDQKQLAFNSKVNTLISENAQLIEQFQTAKHELNLLIKQKQADNEEKRVLSERLASADRTHSQLEDRCRELRENVINSQYRDDSGVSEMRSAYQRLNEQLELELKAKKSLENQVIASSNIADRLKKVEVESTYLATANDRLTKQLKASEQETRVLQQQFHEESQKNAILEKANIKVYQLQKEFEVSQNHLKDTQVALALANKKAEEKELKLNETTLKAAHVSQCLELKQVEESQVREQMKREIEKRVVVEKHLEQIQQELANKTSDLRESHRLLDVKESDNLDLKERLKNESERCKDARVKEALADQSVHRLVEELAALQQSHDGLNDKLVKLAAKSTKSTEDSRLIFEEQRSQFEGETIQLTNQIASLQASLELQHRELSSLTDSLHLSESKLAHHKARLQEEQERSKTLQQSLDASEEQAEQLLQQLAELSKREGKLKEQLAKISHQSQQFAAAKEKHFKEVKQVSEMKVKIAEKQLQNKDIELQNSAARAFALEEHLTDLSRQTATLVRAESDLLSAEGILNSLEERLKHSEALTEQLQIERETLCARILQLEAQLSTASAKEITAKSTENHLRETKQNDKQTIKQLEENLLKIKESLAKQLELSHTNEGFAREREEYTILIRTLKHKIESLQISSVEREAEVLQQTQELEEVTKSLKNANKRIKNLQEELEIAAQETDQLHAKLAGYSLQLSKSAHSEQSAEMHQIALLKQKEQRHIDTIEKLQAEVHRLDNHNEDLQFQKKSAELALSKAQVRLANGYAGDDTSQTNQRVIELEMQLHQLQTKYSLQERSLIELTDLTQAKNNLYEKYAVSFDPIHPAYTQQQNATTTLKKFDQNTSANKQPLFSPRKAHQLPNRDIASQQPQQQQLQQHPQQQHQQQQHQLPSILKQQNNNQMMQQYNSNRLHGDLLVPGGQHYNYLQNAPPSFEYDDNQHQQHPIDQQVLRHCQTLTRRY